LGHSVIEEGKNMGKGVHNLLIGGSQTNFRLDVVRH